MRFDSTPRLQNNEIGIIEVPFAFDFPQLEFTLTFIQLVGVIKQCAKVLFDPMNNGLGRTTIPFTYYMLALVCLIMSILYLLRLLKTVISRLAPDTGNFMQRHRNADADADADTDALTYTMPTAHVYRCHQMYIGDKYHHAHDEDDTSTQHDLRGGEDSFSGVVFDRRSFFQRIGDRIRKWRNR